MRRRRRLRRHPRRRPSRPLFPQLLLLLPHFLQLMLPLLLGRHRRSDSLEQARRSLLRLRAAPLEALELLAQLGKLLLRLANRRGGFILSLLDPGLSLLHPGLSLLGPGLSLLRPGLSLGAMHPGLDQLDLKLLNLRLELGAHRPLGHGLGPEVLQLRPERLVGDGSVRVVLRFLRSPERDLVSSRVRLRFPSNLREFGRRGVRLGLGVVPCSLDVGQLRLEALDRRGELRVLLRQPFAAGRVSSSIVVSPSGVSQASCVGTARPSSGSKWLGPRTMTRSGAGMSAATA